jgi:hypothetical protein
MSNPTEIRTSAFEAQTIVDFAGCLDFALTQHQWLLGDDQSTILKLAADISALAHIIDNGIRTDIGIRTEATRMMRIVQRRAKRDQEGGLLDIDPTDVIALLDPDYWAKDEGHGIVQKDDEPVEYDGLDVAA